MPYIPITPENTLSLLPPRGHPGRFDFMLGLIRQHVEQPLTRENDPFAIQAANVYTAENMACPWDPAQAVDTFVIADADILAGDRARFGQGVLFFEEAQPNLAMHPPPPPSPPSLPVPVSTPENMDIAIGAPPYQVPAPPSPPPLVAAMIERHNIGDLGARVSAEREDLGEPLELARALVIALTEALVQALTNAVMNTPPPYGRAEKTPEITYEETQVNMYEEQPEAEEDYPEQMELQHPGWETISPMVGSLTAAGEEQDSSSNEEDTAVTVIDVDAITDDEDEENQLTELDNSRYPFRPPKPTPKTCPMCSKEMYDPFPDRVNLALQGDEAANLELLLARPPKHWTGKDRVVIKTAIQSLTRALDSGVGYGQAPRAHPAHSF